MAVVEQQEIIGNLIPNVYIRKISLESSGTTLKEDDPHIDHSRESLSLRKSEDVDSLVVNLELVIKEKLDNDLIGTWFANKELNKYMQIKVFQSTEPRTTALLSAGRDLLDLVEAKKAISSDDVRLKLASTVLEAKSEQEVFEKLERRVALKVLEVNKESSGVTPNIKQYEETVDDEGNRVFNIVYHQRFELPNSNLEHLAYFAKTSFDVEQLAQDYELDLNAAGIEKVEGKIASELVIDNFEIQGRSFVFLDPNGKIWAGEVHRLPSGQYRSNSVESPSSVNLQRNSVSNTKIQDFRDVKEIERLILDFSILEKELFSRKVKTVTRDKIESDKQTPYFSEIVLSRDKDGDAKFFFSVDFSTAIKEQAVLGKLFENAGEETKREMSENTHIRSLRIYRQRVKKDSSLNKLGSPYGVQIFDSNEPRELVVAGSEKAWKQFKDVSLAAGTLKELEIDTGDNSLVRHFTGTDLTMSDLTDGVYQYVVELEVNDATVVFLNQKIQTLSNAKNELERFLAEGSKPHSFDVISNRFTTDFIQIQEEKYSENPKHAPWVKPVRVYIDTLGMFTELLSNRSKKHKITKSLFSFVSPRTGNPSGIMKLISLIELLISKMSEISGVTLNTSLRRFEGVNSSTIQGPILNAGRSPENTFKISKEFSNTFDSDVVKFVGMDYLSKGEDETDNIDGLRVISNREYQERADFETLRYFKTLKPDINLRFGGQNFTENDDIRNTNFSYFSPVRVDFSKNSVLLTGERKNTQKQKKILKNKKNRKVKHIEEGTESTEEATTQVYVAMLAANSSVVPSMESPNKSSNKSKKRKKSSTKATQESTKRTYDKFFAEHGNIISNPIRVEAKKDPEDGLVVLGPILNLPQPEVSFTCVEPESDPEKLFVSQNGSEADGLFEAATEFAPLNHFYASLATPVMQKGTTATNNLNKLGEVQTANPKSVKRRENVSLVQDFTLQNLSIIPAANESSEKQIKGLKSIVTEKKIKELPNQIKALFLATSSQNVIRPDKFKGVGSTQAPEKAKNSASLSLNFEMLRRVEYLAGFEKDRNGNVLIKNQIWKLFTEETVNEKVGKKILCRLLPYENKDFGVFRNKGTEVPVYDEYFIFHSSQRIESRDAAMNDSLEDLVELDTQTKDIEEEFISNNFVVNKPLIEQAQEFAEEINDITSFSEALAQKTGQVFVASMNLTEEQSEKLLRLIPSSARTQVEAQESLGDELKKMGFLGEEEVEDKGKQKQQQSTVVQLIKKSRR